MPLLLLDPSEDSLPQDLELFMRMIGGPIMRILHEFILGEAQPLHVDDGRDALRFLVEPLFENWQREGTLLRWDLTILSMALPVSFYPKVYRAAVRLMDEPDVLKAYCVHVEAQEGLDWPARKAREFTLQAQPDPQWLHDYLLRPSTR